MFTKEAQALAKATVEAIKRISKGKWEWEPEASNIYCLHKGILKRIFRYGVREELGEAHWYVWFTEKSYARAPEVIPLLHWERIEQVLEGMGYQLDIDVITDWRHTNKHHYNVLIRPLKEYEGGKTRQEAVMRAVIELGKKE